MATVSTEFSSAFHESVRLMVELDDVMRTGDPDGEEAEALRDQMERPWYAISIDEERLIRGLSQDLYTIGTERTVARDVVQCSDELADSLNKKDWVSALELLRREEPMLPPADVAAMRGVCWGSLGEHSAALAFIGEALRLAPTNSQFLALHWTELVRAARISEAAHDALARLAAESLVDSYALFKAADVLLLRATRCPESEAAPLSRQAISAIQQGLEHLPPEPLEPELSRARIEAYLDMALSYAQIEDRQHAVEACDRALQLDPSRPDALMLRAWLRQPVDPISAKADLRRSFAAGLSSRFAEEPLPDVMPGALF